ncbi:PREDICTED: uncharacterized protein LOC106819427 [Priapulus caudatus]|uniref:Uncharacterized protein LOC106819427 n=1 Tax=Priapulus caudatus TaxID=37621 RepID=A0ABM1F532_PRICU|nr:PREDICTED: uncharacterized protein LOC106819427 [Priapulus caudatus]
MDFLSKQPCTVTDGLQPAEITVAEEREMFKRQAAEDWETILVHRARELRPGGRLVIVPFATDKDKQYTGNTKRIKCNGYNLLSKKCRELVNRGVITKEEFQNMNHNAYYRTEEELEEPLINVDSPVYKLGLRLVSIEVKQVNCYFHDRWVESGDNGDIADARAHAKSYVCTFRIWAHSDLLHGLSDSRSPEEKANILDAFFQSFEDAVAENPRDHGKDYIVAYVHMRKLE